MAREPSVMTYYEAGVWKNTVDGNGRASNVPVTKAEAQRTGRQMAVDRCAEHVIKNKDGRIGEKNSYGNDPHPPKG